MIVNINTKVFGDVMTYTVREIDTNVSEEPAASVFYYADGHRRY
jgi:hypothetical protein